MAVGYHVQILNNQGKCPSNVPVSSDQPVAWVIKRRKDTSLFHSRSDAEAVCQVVVTGNPETLCNIFIYLLILTSALPSQCTVAENHHSFLMMFDGSLSQAVSK